MDLEKEINEILTSEANAILNLVSKININQFKDALILMSNCKGKVIITGMGKSGHIGNKIAATLSSLGTPSLFLHPAEGVHGDLGVVEKEDVVITISNSGESDEILNLLPSLEIIGPKIIALTGGLQSKLALSSDVVINTTIENEVDHLGLAPTSSTTATLALGDTLAIILSKMKGFTPEDFGLYHPAGALGKKVLGER